VLGKYDFTLIVKKIYYQSTTSMVSRS